jgi:hypothetical protein
LFGRAPSTLWTWKTYFLALYVSVPFSTIISLSPPLIHVSRDEDLHPRNVTALEAWRAALPPYGPCSGSHPHIVSCAYVPIERFFVVFRWTLPIYGALHVVPMLLFKRRAFAHAPRPMLLRAGWGSTRSAVFLAAFVAIYQGAVGSVFDLLSTDGEL